jgi:nicotinic acid phosphoribosyltransferase
VEAHSAETVQDETGRRIPRAKRGDLAGRKNVFRDPETVSDVVTTSDNPPDGRYVPLLFPLVRNGKIVREFRSLDDLEERTRALVKKVNSVSPTLRWEQGK